MKGVSFGSGEGAALLMWEEEESGNILRTQEDPFFSGMMESISRSEYFEVDLLEMYALVYK